MMFLERILSLVPVVPCLAVIQSGRLKAASSSCGLAPSLVETVKEVICRRYGTSLEELILEMNPVLRGWNNYRTTAQPERKRLVKLNSFIRERFRIFLKRKHNDQSRGAWRVHGNVLGHLGLFQLG